MGDDIQPASPSSGADSAHKPNDEKTGDPATLEDHDRQLNELESGHARTDESVLSDTRLFVLGTVFTLWACNAGALLQTAFVLPIMAKEFDVSPSQVQWVAASCMTVWGCLQVIAGRLCDIYGRKKGFYIGAAIWIPARLLSLMPNLASTNVCRALSGVGAAILLPASSGIVGALYPAGKKRTWAFAAISAGGASGAASGELFAEIFLEFTRWTWRPCFLLNAVVSLYPPLIVLWLVSADAPHSRSKKMDWIGSALLGGSLFLLLFSFTVSQTDEKGWKAPYLPALFVGFGILLVLFVLRQRQLLRAARLGLHRPPPLIPGSLLTVNCWNLLIIYLASFCAWAAIDTIITPMAYLYFDVLNMNRFEAGLKLSLCAVSGGGAAILVAVCISRVPPRALIAICCAATTATPVLFAIRGIDWPFYYADLWAILFIGLATDCTVAAGLTLISTTAPIEDGSVASALFQTSCRLGYPFGLAIATLLSTSVERRSLSQGEDPRIALLYGLRGAFWVCAGFVFLASLIVAFGMRGWTMLDGTVPSAVGEARTASSPDIEDKSATEPVLQADTKAQA